MRDATLGVSRERSLTRSSRVAGASSRLLLAVREGVVFVDVAEQALITDSIALDYTVSA